MTEPATTFPPGLIAAANDYSPVSPSVFQSFSLSP